MNKYPSLAFALLLTAPAAFAYSISPEEFYRPGNNAYFTAVPDPSKPGYLMDGDAMLRTEPQMAAGITTYSGLPAGSFDPMSGITIFIPAWIGVVPELSALNLRVGPAALVVLRNYHPSVFTEVFGVYRENTFGFAGIGFLDGFGIAGTPIRFAYDNPHQADANRFLTTAAIAVGYRNAYVSNPLVRQVPDGGSAALLMALGCAACAGWRRQP
jgi:hypothetical protein